MEADLKDQSILEYEIHDKIRYQKNILININNIIKMNTNSYIVKAQDIESKILQANRGFDVIQDKANSNLKKLKDLKSKFSSVFGKIVEELENLPEEKTKPDETEVSPASIRSITVWEWQYNLESTKQFVKDSNDLYSTYGGSGTINAFSSHAVNESFTWKVKFHSTVSFGCGGFGIISKNDPNFEKSYGNYAGHPLCCLCCSGSWSAGYMNTKGGQALQYRLKNNNEKILAFELNMDERLFKIYDPDGVLFADYSIDNMTYKDDLVLFYHSGSNTNHSHEIICE